MHPHRSLGGHAAALGPMDMGAARHMESGSGGMDRGGSGVYGDEEGHDDEADRSGPSASDTELRKGKWTVSACAARE